MRTDEQALHDRINLPRLVKRLEQAIQDGDWPRDERETWLRAQATLQQIQHAHLLLKHVELDNADPTPAEERRYQHFGTTLQHLEDYIRQVEHQSTPPLRRPKPLLPSIRPPTTKPPPTEPSSPPVEDTLIPSQVETSDVHDLLPASPDLVSPPVASTSSAPLLAPTPVPGPSRTPPTHRGLPPGFYPSPSPSPAPPSTSSLAQPTTSTSTITATPTILSNARAHHDYLSEQLAQMATQLRQNATHVSEALGKDRSVVETLQEKIDGNLGSMQRERIRLRDVRGKSGGTTCLVIMSVVVVLIAFIVMVFVIRLSR